MITFTSLDKSLGNMVLLGVTLTYGIWFILEGMEEVGWGLVYVSILLAGWAGRYLLRHNAGR